MSVRNRVSKAVCSVLPAVWFLLAVLSIPSYCADDALVTFLKNIDHFGRTKEQVEERLGPPDVVIHNATPPLVTKYYYPGLEAQFDDYAGRITVLTITSNHWAVDGGVTIGMVKTDVAATLGNRYLRLSGDGGVDVWVYLCPRPTSDMDALICNSCRVCYVSFSGNRVSRIEWSTKLLGGYE